MAKEKQISKEVRDYFKEVKTTHTKWVVGSKTIDLSKDNVSEADLKLLAQKSPKLFVLKPAPKAADTKPKP